MCLFSPFFCTISVSEISKTHNDKCIPKGNFYPKLYLKLIRVNIVLYCMKFKTSKNTKLLKAEVAKKKVQEKELKALTKELNDVVDSWKK